MTEDAMLRGVIDAALWGGWLVHHVRRSDKALTMGSPGFPDVVMVPPRHGRGLALELKSDRGRVRPGQAEWLAAFRAAGIDARLITPADYDATLQLLRSTP